MTVKTCSAGGKENSYVGSAKDWIFYSVAATIIGVIAQQAGASLGTIFMVSLIVPPVLLFAYRIYRNR